ncbi:MAG: hypothetical protein ACUVRG_10805 [Ignavibacterium sp.]|uniref:hypothetical protein n=1 Tax=Ignavibacterium sp. TaxID=2651167 RepID=UPI0040493FE2
MIFIIATAFSDIKQSGYFFWRDKYYSQIKNYLPKNITSTLGIGTAIVYFCKNEQKFKNSLLINITGVQLTSNFLKLNYSIAEEMQYKSYQIRTALRKYLNKKTILELPFCAAVDESDFFNFINDLSIEDKLSLLEQNNDWLSIIKILDKFQPMEKSQIWNNSNLLNRFSFATAKLAECSNNIKIKFPDKLKRKEYLEEKKKFRELTIKLRKRCIELENDNPSFYSNLAYTYYQSATELSTPGGRRDGNLKNDATHALYYLDKALELDDNRITDLYRKANLLSDILSNNILFNPNTDLEINEKYNQAFNYREMSIKTFETLLTKYDNISDENQKKRFFKYYIKTLYKLALLNFQLGKTNINTLNLLYNHQDGLRHNNPLFKSTDENSEQKLIYLNKAINYLEKCIMLDSGKKEQNLIDAATSNNFIIGVYKAYLMGKIYLYKFLLTKDLSDEKTAKEFMLKAHETEFPKELKKQNKIFVLEKLAILYLIEEQPKTAIHLLENAYKRIKIFPEYAALTLAISYLLNNQKNESLEVVEQYLHNEKSLLHDKFKKLHNALQAKKEADVIKLIYSTNIKQ